MLTTVSQSTTIILGWQFPLLFSVTCIFNIYTLCSLFLNTICEEKRFMIHNQFYCTVNQTFMNFSGCYGLMNSHNEDKESANVSQGKTYQKGIPNN